MNFGKVELRENSAGDSCFRRNDGSPTPALPKGEGVFLSFGGVRGGVFLFSFFLFSCTNSEAFVFTDTTQNKLILTNDSGFVTKKEGLAFLLANSLTDTSEYKTSWDLCSQSDTIGKYYRMGNSDNYIMCLANYGDTIYGHIQPIIIKIGSNGELVKSEKFYHRLCGRVNEYSNFSKYGDIFSIELCCRGPGFCSSDLYLFKDVTPFDSITPIPFMCWFADGEIDDFSSFTSKMEIKNDELSFHYVLESGKYKYNKKKGKSDFKVHYRKEFTIKYFYENGKWITNDSDNLKELEQWSCHC